VFISGIANGMTAHVDEAIGLAMTDPTENISALREATAADVDVVHTLVEHAYRGDTARQGWTHEADLLGGQRTDAATLMELIADPDHRLILLESSDALIGCVDVHARPGSTAYLGLLAVDPAQQAGGHGKRLIAAAESCARDVFGATQIEMTVIAQRPELIAYYARRDHARPGLRRAGETAVTCERVIAE